MNNKVSIIVPIYNTEKYLDRCIRSLIHQDYDNLEIILVDDGSTDSSGEICDHYKNKDSRIKVLHRTNHGCVWARKEGIKNSSGEYVMFCDSDDYVEPNMVSLLLEKLTQTQADIVISGYYTENGLQKSKNNNLLAEGLYNSINIDFLYQNMMFDMSFGKPGVLQSMCGKLFKKELLFRILINQDERITFGEDAANVYLYLLESKTILLLNQCFYHYCIRENSMCRTKDMDIFFRIQVFYAFMQAKFQNTPYKYKLSKQLKAYIVHFIEMAICNNYDIELSPLYKFANDIYSKIVGKKIIMYGAGKVGRCLVPEIEHMHGVELVRWVDKKLCGRSFYRIPIMPVETIKDIEFDYIVVSVLYEDVYREIKKELSLFVEENRIIWAAPTVDKWTRIYLNEELYE